MDKWLGSIVAMMGFAAFAGAQGAVGGVCQGTMPDNLLLIDARASHTYKINMEPTRFAAIPGVVAKFEAGRTVKEVFILSEKEATYVDVQNLVDALLKAVPGLQVGILQQPADLIQKCVAAAPTGSTSKFFVTIPLPAKAVQR